jgi:uncharacterized protein (DUF1697 family)
MKSFKNIPSVDSGSDEYTVVNDIIYVYCPGGAGKTKFNTNFFEKKLKVEATTRNYNTIKKLTALT